MCWESNSSTRMDVSIKQQHEIYKGVHISGGPGKGFNQCIIDGPLWGSL